MKNITKKLSPSSDRGIAILFSLVMLITFFILAFGFLGQSIAAKRSSNIRGKAAEVQSLLDSTIKEAAAFTETELFNTRNISSGIKRTKRAMPDLEVMEKKVGFTNTEEAIFNAWGTMPTSPLSNPVESNLKDYFLLSDAWAPTKDIYGDPTLQNDANYQFGWNEKTFTDGGGITTSKVRWAWIVLDNSPIDPNTSLAATRVGNGSDEIDLTALESTYAAKAGGWQSRHELASNFTNAKIVKSVVPTATKETSVTVSTASSGSATEDRYNINLAASETDAAAVIDKINWLKDASISASDEILAKHIAACIRDYTDGDLFATTGSDHCGNEFVQYFNEFAFEITNLTTASTEATISLNVKTELIALYRDLTNNNADFLMDTIEIKGTRDGKAVSFIFKVNHTSQAMSANLSSLPGATTSAFQEIDFSAATLDSKTDTTDAADISAGVAATALTITEIKFSAKSHQVGTVANVYDWVKDVTMTFSEEILTSDSDTFRVEVNDSRNNFNASEWTYIDKTANSSITYTLNTPGENNSVFSAAAGEDNTITYPWESSTCYIRNGAMTSLSELGVIHRGESHRTLNLVDYNYKNEAYINNYEPTGTLSVKVRDDVTPYVDDRSTFDGGDRSLLDDLTLAWGDDEDYGKINPNTSDQSVLEALFSNITGGYDTEGQRAHDKGRNIDASEIYDRFPAFQSTFDYLNTFSSDMFVTREATDVRTYSDVIVVNPMPTIPSQKRTNSRNPAFYGKVFEGAHTKMFDREKEELLWKTKNLLSTRYSFLTVLSAVQVYDAANTLIAEKCANALIRRDNEKDEIEIIRIKYFDPK